MLIPLDNSINAQAALEPGAALLTTLASPEQKIELHLIQIVKPFLATERHNLLNSAAFSQAQHAMTQTATLLSEGYLAPYIAQHHIPVTWSVISDTDVAKALLRMAESAENTEHTGYELIAISTHGRGGFQRWIMGSVTERVLATTERPILIVHPREK